jgi:hypothetical protein
MLGVCYVETLLMFKVLDANYGTVQYFHDPRCVEEVTVAAEIKVLF